MDFNKVTEFEKKISDFFGSKYSISVDSCTHGIELCLRLQENTYVSVPKRTYLSIPFLSKKLNIDLFWRDEDWVDYYLVNNEKIPIYDAAVLWKKNSYIPSTFMCISFQYQKHLSLGRGGVILTDDLESYELLKKMSYDGRFPGIPWREQNIKTYGYHYYMTPETAQKGLEKLELAITTTPKQWVVTDWPDLTQMDIFKTNNNSNIDPYLQTR